MASAGIDFGALTPSNGALQTVNELIFRKVLGEDRLSQLFNVIYGAVNGKKVGFIGEFGLVGKPAQGCNPEYDNTTISTSEKEWELGEWTIDKSICYKDLKGTLAQTAMRRGVNMADLTETEYIDDIVYPRLELAIYKMLMRLAWFGDEGADNVSDGGVITNGVDVRYFSVTNGFWKRFYSIVAEDDSRRVTIAANSEASYASQKSALLGNGVAMGIMDNLIMGASAELRQADNQVIFITQSLKDALNIDIRNNNKGSELQWQSVFFGITETVYNGTRVVALPFWDSIIQAYEDTGAKWNKPHRAVYTTTDNLLVGIDGYTDFAELDVFFDKMSELNVLKSKGELGTLVAQDNMVQVAY